MCGPSNGKQACGYRLEITSSGTRMLNEVACMPDEGTMAKDEGKVV